MTHSKKKQIACLLFVLVLMTAGFAFVGANSSYRGVLNVAVQASPAQLTPVENDLTVTTQSITLGSAIQATGNVKTADGPLANAPVALHMGDIVLAHTQTDAHGHYSFSVPVGVYYIPAALVGGAAIYTVVEPLNASFASTASAVTEVSINELPLYLAIVVVTGAIIIVLYFYTRRMHGKALLEPLRRERAKPGAERLTTRARRMHGKALLEPLRRERAKPGAEPISEALAPHTVETAELRQISNLFEHVDERGAVNELFDAAVRDLAATHEVTISSRATHWEKYYAIEAAVPEVRAAMHTLTVAWCTNYRGKRLNNRQRHAVIEAFSSIQAHVKNVKNSGVRAEPIAI